MNIKLILIIPFCIISQIQAVELKKDIIMQAITSAHTRAFSKDSLILSRPQAKDLTSWNEAVDAVKQFVQKNAPSLTTYFNKIDSVSNDLINTLKVSFNGYVAPILKNPKDKEEGLSRIDPSKINLTKLNITGLDRIIKPLQTSENDLKQIQDELNKELEAFRKSRFTSKEKGDAAELLIRLALTLEMTITKAIKDTQKLALAVNQAQTKPAVIP